jgi:tryptophan synthase alpha chain
LNSSGEEKIRFAFQRSREEKRGSLIGYLTAGDPSPRETPKLCHALIDGGVDILELGIPFSDPIADGPTIQAASGRALEAGTTPTDCLKIVEELRNAGATLPIVFLTYYNSIFRFGVDRFISKSRAFGVDGIVVPDLPIIGSSEFVRYVRSERKNGVASILLATPTTSEERLKSILKETTGFLYLVSLLGVTGVRKNASVATEFIRQTSRITHDSDSSTPLAVGFGISEPAHVQNILKAGADGAIVGSALVNIVAKNSGDLGKAADELKEFTASLRKATYLR